MAWSRPPCRAQARYGVMFVLDRAAATCLMGVALEFVAGGPSADHFRLLSLGRPLADYPVDLVTADGKRAHLRTDAKGEVHLVPAA